MKTFNLNDYILVCITQYGWKHLRNTLPEDYIIHCIDTRKVMVGDVMYHKLQAHEVMRLFGNAPMSYGSPPISSNILIPD